MAKISGYKQILITLMLEFRKKKEKKILLSVKSYSAVKEQWGK